jgi:adenylate cyclase
MFFRAIEQDPNYALAYAGLADCYSYLLLYFDNSKEIAELSASTSKKALELDRNLAEAHSARGFALSLNIKYTEAEKEFNKAIELNPKLYETYYFYGRTCRQQGNFIKAASLFRKALEVRPDDYQAQLFLGDAYRDLKLSDKAKEAHQRAIVLSEKHLQLNPDDARSLYLGAGALVKLGESDKAINWCERAIAIDPNDPSVLYNVSCSYSLLGKIDKALDYFERSIDSGLTAKEWIETDSDLDSIRNKPRFKKIMIKLK